MSIAALRKMEALGLSLADAIEVLEAIETAPVRSSGAERQARYRARKAGVTSDVTGDVTPSDETLSPSPPPRTPPPRPHTRGNIYTPAREADFDAFWDAYPAKIGKKAALKAWGLAKDRPDLPALLAAIDQYRLTKPPDRDWCHPSTWLNQGRWDDAAPDPTPRPGNPRHDRPDKLTAKLDNLDRGFRAAERASEFVAASRTF